MFIRQEGEKSVATNKVGIAQRWYGMLQLFDVAEGTVVMEPEASGQGYWVGAPSLCYDSQTGKFYLNTRHRRPVGKGRGWQTRISESDDGIHFKEIWSAHKEDFNSSSIERSCLIKTQEGRFRLYVSFSDLRDNRWRIELMEADHPKNFDPKRRISILGSEDIENCEGIKDPVIIILGGMYYMFAGYGLKSEVKQGVSLAEIHLNGNCFATPYIRHPSGLAISADGIHFEWKGKIMEGGPGIWDIRVNRVSSVLWVPPVFYAFYDGRTGINDCYTGRTGYYVSIDLVNFHKITVDKPALQSPFGSGGLRYMDSVVIKDKVYYYYEFTREDESHDLRLSIVKL